MKYLCAFCKKYAEGQETGEARLCTVKQRAVEPWFVACADSFRDRRERKAPRFGQPDRRRRRTLTAVA